MVKKIASFFCFFLSLTLLNAQEEQKKDFVFQDSDSTAVSLTDSIDLVSVPYNWISYQMRATITNDGDAKTFQIFFVNRIDSIIYLNINLFGIEFARAVAKPDSLIFVDKINRTYYQGDYRWLSKKIGTSLDFNILQSVFNARDFKDFEDSLIIADSVPNIHLIAPSRKNSDSTLTIMQEMVLNADNTILQNEVTDLNTMRSMNITYGGYVSVSDILFFSSLKVDIESEQISFDAEVKNVKIDVPGPTRIKIPEKFEPIN